MAADTRRLVRLVQASQGSPQDGVLQTPQIRALKRYVELTGRAPRLIPMRMSVQASDAVNALARRIAPDAILLQAQTASA